MARALVSRNAKCGRPEQYHSRHASRPTLPTRPHPSYLDGIVHASSFKGRHSLVRRLLISRSQIRRMQCVVTVAPADSQPAQPMAQLPALALLVRPAAAGVSGHGHRSSLDRHSKRFLVTARSHGAEL